MKEEVDRINQVLPNVNFLGKATEMQQWIDRVIDGIERFKNQHNALLKEASTLLELALWKAKLDEDKVEDLLKVMSKKAKIDNESTRQERRVIYGASMSIVIKNVLPFLQLA